MTVLYGGDVVGCCLRSTSKVHCSDLIGLLYDEMRFMYEGACTSSVETVQHGDANPGAQLDEA